MERFKRLEQLLHQDDDQQVQILSVQMKNQNEASPPNIESGNNGLDRTRLSLNLNQANNQKSNKNPHRKLKHSQSEFFKRVDLSRAKQQPSGEGQNLAESYVSFTSEVSKIYHKGRPSSHYRPKTSYPAAKPTNHRLLTSHSQTLHKRSSNTLHGQQNKAQANNSNCPTNKVLRLVRQSMSTLHCKQTASLVSLECDKKLKQGSMLQLFEAKCCDSKLAFSKEQSVKFLQKLDKVTVNRRINLANSNIGFQTVATLCQLLIDHPEHDYFYLDLQKNKLGDEGAYEIARMLKINKSIAYLNLASNCIRQKGVEHVLGALKNNMSVVSLDLSSKDGMNKNLMRSGGRVLAEALRHNESLQILNLQNTQMNLQSLKYLCIGLRNNPSLIILNISHNELGVQCAGLIADLLKTRDLQYLNIAGNKLGNQGIKLLFDFFYSSPRTLKLVEMDISQNKFTSKTCGTVFEVIKKNHTMRRFNMSGNDFSEEIRNLSSCISDNHYLSELILDSCKLEKENCCYIAEGLKKCKSISVLSLNDNEVSSEGASQIFKSLAYNTTLEKLSLKNCQINDRPLEQLQIALSSNQTLKHLNLSGNFISDIGAGNIAEGLLKNKYIFEINLSLNLISYKLMQEINYKLSQNKMQDINSQVPSDVRRLESLQELVSKAEAETQGLEEIAQTKKQKLTKEIQQLADRLAKREQQSKKMLGEYEETITKLDETLRTLASETINYYPIQVLSKHIQDTHSRTIVEINRVKQLEHELSILQAKKQKEEKVTRSYKESRPNSRKSNTPTMKLALRKEKSIKI